MQADVCAGGASQGVLLARFLSRKMPLYPNGEKRMKTTKLAGTIPSFRVIFGEEKKDD